MIKPDEKTKQKLIEAGFEEIWSNCGYFSIPELVSSGLIANTYRQSNEKFSVSVDNLSMEQLQQLKEFLCQTFSQNQK